VTDLTSSDIRIMIL